jgi:acetylornithine aminotransferase
MRLFDVYPLFDIAIQRAEGSYVFDSTGNRYLDFYGGHAVISVGHGHPHFVEGIQNQLSKIGFYSNSVVNPLQEKLAHKFSEISGLEDYALFLCNSGAEANENAIKLASFFNQRNKVLALDGSFHGRMSATGSASYCLKYKSKIGTTIHTDYFNVHSISQLLEAIQTKEYACLLIEKIQGIGGLDIISTQSLKQIKKACDETDTILILDEVQSGCGRSGKYFAFQHDDVEPDIITMAKGIGNGFPIGGLLVNDHKIKSKYGLLGSTFGGNHLACAAANAVIEILQKDNLIDHVAKISQQLKEALILVPGAIAVKGMGLMLGVEFDFPIAPLRKALVNERFTFVGSSSNPNLLRILPPLNIGQTEIDWFVKAITDELESFEA